MDQGPGYFVLWQVVVDICGCGQLILVMAAYKDGFAVSHYGMC